MKEALFNPTPSRLLIATADESSGSLAHFTPYSLPEGSARLAEVAGFHGLRVPSDEVTALFIAREALTMSTTPEEATELGTFFAVIAYGGCRYLLGDRTAQSQVGAEGQGRFDHLKQRQNRYGNVPRLATPDPAQRPNTEQLRDRAVQSIDVAIHMILTRTASLKHQLPPKKQRAVDLLAGRYLLEAASQLAVIGAGDTTADLGNHIGDNDAQLISRDACMRAMNISVDLGIETQTHTSLIQGASLISPAAVELQRTGSPEVTKLFTAAYNIRGDQTARSFSTKNGWFLT